MSQFIWSRSLELNDIKNRRVKMRITKFWFYLWFCLAIGAIGIVIYFFLQNFKDLSILPDLLFNKEILNIIFWMGLLGFLILTREYLTQISNKTSLIKNFESNKSLAIDKFFTLNALSVIDEACLNWQKDKKPVQYFPFYLLFSLLKTFRGQMMILRLAVYKQELNKKIKKIMTSNNLQEVNKFSTLQQGISAKGGCASGAKLSRKDLLYSHSGKVLDKIDYIKTILYKSFEFALRSQKPKVDIEDIFVSLSIIPSDVKDFLIDQGIHFENMQGTAKWLQISDELQREIKSASPWRLERTKHWRNQLWTSTVTPLLDSVGQDLTAQTVSFYPLVDREEELQKIYELIKIGTYGLLLLGPKGAGITKLIKGLAQKIVAQEVPASLADRRVHTLSLGRILALSNAQSPIKSLTQQLNKEIQRSGNIILVLEDLPALETVKAEEAAIILEQLLLDALNNKNLILIGTADTHEFANNQGVLLNSLQIVEVKPLSEKITLEVLETMAPYLEHEYKVYLTYQALERVAELSKYLHDLAQPAQAVQVLRRICESSPTLIKEGMERSSWITGQEVEIAISKMTQLPLAKVAKQESDILVNLEELIYQKYVNQEEAVKAVAGALRRARTQLKDEQRPIGSFLFLGPTGVGKTELARRLAEIYFKTPQSSPIAKGGIKGGSMIRLDMSEYQEIQSLRNLIGAPPGTGAREEGHLIKAVKNNPFSVILLDELEKAHPDILNIFLQVMEDGRITSSLGETYDFSHTIIIGTSNAGAVLIQQALDQDAAIKDIEEDLKKTELVKYFKPEFLNRFDAVVVFKPLSFDQVLVISNILLKELEDQLAEQGILFEASSEGIYDLAKAGFNPSQGARPLRRVIQDKIEDEIAKMILKKKIRQRDKIILKQDFVLDIIKARHF